MVVAVVALIKNEADILPAWLACLGAWADLAVLMDHGSTDGSRDLLAAACRGRSGWSVVDIAEPAYWQERFTAQGASMAFAGGAEWVMPLDADEFLQVPQDLGAALGTVTAPTSSGFRWVNGYPAGGSDGFLAPRGGSVVKLALSRSMWDAGMRHGFGNYQIINPRGRRMPVRVVGDIWHFPARSSNQLQRKRQQAADAILLRGDGQRAPIVSANDPLRVAMNFPMAPRMGGGIAPDLMAAGWTKKRVAPEGVDLVTCP